MEIIRNNSSMPGAFPGMKMFAKEYNNLDTDAAQEITIETGCVYILIAIGVKWVTSGGATPLVVTPTIAASTTYSGTKKVTFSIPSLSTLHCLIIGSTEMEYSTDLADNGGNVTEVLFEA